MTAREQQIFIEVRSSERREQLWQELIRQSIKPLFRDVNKTLFHAKAVSRKREIITFEIDEGQAPLLRVKQKLTMIFEVDGEKHIARGSLANIVVPRFDLEMLTPLHRIQRRSNFRLDIPSHFGYLVESDRLTAPILDLSAGGCRVSAPISSGVKAGQFFDGRLKFEDRTFGTLRFEVRHTRPVDAKTIHVGLQFQFIEPAIEFQLLKYVFLLEKRIGRAYQSV